MGLEYAHKGYEYQDLLSTLFIIEQLLKNNNYNNIRFKFDLKESTNDKFDDITIISGDQTIKRQIKYSEEKVLEKSDLSSSDYDLALDVLYNSWLEIDESINCELRLCLSWNYIGNNPDLDFLNEINHVENIYDANAVKFFKVDLDKIWRSGTIPISSWRRLRDKSSNIDRDRFGVFLSKLIIETNLPKASLDLHDSGDLEKLVIFKLKQLGIGKYPNNSKSVEDILLNLTHIVKSYRAKGEEISLETIIYKLGLKIGYGNIEQNIDIDLNINVFNQEKFDSFYNYIESNNKIILIGEPGSGKSWFLQNFIKYLETSNKNIIRHFCFTGIDDAYEKERITIDIFLANLISDIINIYPELGEIKSTKYGVDISELQNLLNNIKEETFLIIDGLDHIGRVFNFHKNILREVDTEIIKIISSLNVNDNIKVILASQPIQEIHGLINTNYKAYQVSPWDIYDIKIFLDRNKYEDKKLGKSNLSDILLEKSNGNPLYLTYLLKELKVCNPIIITKEFINIFPAYNNNLENYYNYIMTKIPEDKRVPQILSGAPFYLTEDDLIEITKQGKYVSQSIEAMQSILSFNAFNGGYTIYHESFRRYILEYLKAQEVDIEEAIYQDLIDWLKKKGFYQDRKSYRNLLTLLFETKKYKEILEFCNKEFVVDSICYGNNIISIKRNYEFLVKTACKIKSYETLVTCTELSNMIYNFEYSFDENAELYFKGMGLLFGYQKLKDYLVFEGQLELGLEEGFKVCYLCSTNNVVPDWEPYIQLLRENNVDSNKVKELYRYYICACIDMNKDMNKVIKLVTDEEADYYREIIINEYARRDQIEELVKLIDLIPENNYWKQSISSFFEPIVNNENLYDSIFDNLKELRVYSDEAKEYLYYYINNIEWIIKNREEDLIKFLNEIENQNWFHNWLIYVAKINKVLMFSDNINEKDIIGAYEWLIKDVNPFNGTPRACDLYGIEKIIYDTIKKPLLFINENSTWKDTLDIINEMSKATITSLRGITNGPLTTDKLLNLLVEVVNNQNYEIILKIFNKSIQEEDKYRVYTYLADYSFKYSIILSKSLKKEESIYQFRQGVIYSLAYGYSKDRTFSNLLDSVQFTYMSNKEKGIENVLKLKPLADAVVFHTDGRGTHNYQIEWFQKLVKIDISIASTYLQNELSKYTHHWVLEDSLKFLLIELDSNYSPRIENVLFKTLPNNMEDVFLKSYIINIKTLVSCNFLKQARRSLVDLVTRFGIDRRYSINDIDLFNVIKDLCNEFEIESNHLVFKNEINKKTIKNNWIESLKGNNRQSFDRLSYEDILTYIDENGIIDSEIQGLYMYLSNVNKLDDETKAFLSSIIKIAYERRTSDYTRINIINILENIELDEEIMSFIYIYMFLIHTDGWYHKFTKTDYFIKAHNYNTSIAEFYFFEYIYNNLYSVDYNLSIGSEVIKCLSGIKYNYQIILNCWDNLFDIINFRLPGQEEYEWKNIIRQRDNYDTDETLYLLLLTRLKYGEVNRFKCIISEIDHLLEIDLARKSFIKPLKSIIENRDLYIDYCIIGLLVLIKDNFVTDELNHYGLYKAMSNIYPTDNSIINYLLRTMLKIRNTRIYHDYKQTNYLNDEQINFFFYHLIKIDNRLSILLNTDINVDKIVNNYIQITYDEDFVTNHRELLYNRDYSVVVPNIYFYNELTNTIGLEIDEYINKFVSHPHINIIEYNFFDLVIGDFRMLIAQNNSTIPRPLDLIHPQKISDSKLEVIDEEWIRLGYYEKWFYNISKHKDNFSETNESIIILSGIGFLDTKNIDPYFVIGEENRLYDEFQESSIPLSEIIESGTILTTNINIINNPFLSFDYNQYIGLRPTLLNHLGIKLVESVTGISGVTDNNEVVLKFSKWDVHVTEIDNDSDRIPIIQGSQLLIKKYKFDEISNLYSNKPFIYTKVIDNIKT